MGIDWVHECEYPRNADWRDRFAWFASRVLERSDEALPVCPCLRFGGSLEQDMRRCLKVHRRKHPYYLLEMCRQHQVRLPAHLRVPCRALAAIDQDGRRQAVPHEEVCAAQDRVYAALRSEAWWRDVDLVTR